MRTSHRKNFETQKPKKDKQIEKVVDLEVEEGPASKKLVEEVKKATNQSAIEVIVIQVELGDLLSNITMPSNWLEG